MKRIAVASDSHGGKLHLERFVEYCQAEGIDGVFHLGDFADDARWLEKRVNVISWVAGNCDFRGQREAIVTIENQRILLVHGDKRDVKCGYDNLSYYAEEKLVNVALFGHTHRSFTGYRGKVLLVNPGALRDGSFCVLEVTPEQVVPRILDVDEWYAARRER